MLSRISRLRLVAMVLMCVLSLSGAARAADQSATLRLDWTPLGYHAPFYLGVAKGYYRAAGIDLKIVAGKGSQNVATLTGNGSDEFGFADASTTAQLIGQGLPVKVVMGILQRSTLALFYTRESGIKTPADLKGKRIVLCPTDGLAAYLPAFLGHSGLTMADISLTRVDCSIKYSYFAQKNADAIGGYGTAGPALLEAVGIHDPGKFDYAEAGIFLPSHGIIASDAQIKSDPALIHNFVAATAKSWDDARAHPDEAVKAFMAANPLQENDKLVKDTLVYAFDYLETPGSKGHPFGWQSPAEWVQTTALLEKYTDMKPPSSPDVFYTNEFVAAKATN